MISFPRPQSRTAIGYTGIGVVTCEARRPGGASGRMRGSRGMHPRPDQLVDALHDGRRRPSRVPDQPCPWHAGIRLVLGHPGCGRPDAGGAHAGNAGSGAGAPLEFQRTTRHRGGRSARGPVRICDSFPTARRFGQRPDRPFGERLPRPHSGRIPGLPAGNRGLKIPARDVPPLPGKARGRTALRRAVTVNPAQLRDRTLLHAARLRPGWRGGERDARALPDRASSRRGSPKRLGSRPPVRRSPGPRASGTNRIGSGGLGPCVPARRTGRCDG